MLDGSCGACPHRSSSSIPSARAATPGFPSASSRAEFHTKRRCCCSSLVAVKELKRVFPKIRGTLFGCPHNKDYSILGSISRSLIVGNYQIKLPYWVYTVNSMVSQI